MSSEIKVDTISENTSANGVVIDSVTLKDGGIAATAATTITLADTSTNLTLKSTDASASAAPRMVFERDSASPADDDQLGLLMYFADNDAGESTNFVEIKAFASDVSDGTEDAAYTIDTMLAGTLRERMGFGTVATVFNDDSVDLDFRVETNGNTHGLFVDAGSDFVSIGKNTDDGDTLGHFFSTAGSCNHARNSGNVIAVTRVADDGSLMSFRQAGSSEGSISVSGSTVSYNTFTGSHWSRLADNSKPTILRGTIMDSINEMCDWYQAVADIAEVKYTAEDQEVIDGNKNVGDVKEKARKKREPIALPEGKSVGDAVTFTSSGVEYTGVYEKETDVKHVRCKISDTGDSKRVYGVFSRWDDTDDGLDGDVNDMEIAQVGK